MTRQRSRGSILSFVIVAVLLLGLIAGAVYAVRRGIFNGATKPAEVARETTGDNKSTTGTTSNSNNSQSTTDGQKKNTELSEALKKQAEAEKKAKEQSEAASSQPSTTQPVAIPATQQPSSSTTTIPTTGAHLPQTGPADSTVMMTIGLGVLAAAAVAYKRSRALI